jgi:hypothetical protein
MWLIWIALIVAAFFAGKFGGDVVLKAIGNFFTWLWNKITKK